MAIHDLTGKNFASYHLVRLLGRGGMADVYLAEDTQRQRQVALKVLPPEFARDEDRARRFIKEIRATAELNHPHITTIHEFGESDGLHYFTMSLLMGGALEQRIAGGHVRTKHYTRTQGNGICPWLCSFPRHCP